VAFRQPSESKRKGKFKVCGIHGMVSLMGEPVDPALMRRMGKVTEHRGPDDEGLFVHQSCAIGMRRLSIIDLAGGHQPISNSDDTLWVVCNGEIYNFQELRAELEARGCRFKTHSDTEVVLHSYAEYGDSFVNKLDGMFAFAVYDMKRQRLVIGRDRLGIKPLYYRLDSKWLVFASEAKAILAVAETGPQLDPLALDSYLRLGYVAAPRSIFAGIQKLPTASLLVVEDGRTRIKSYWTLPADVDRTTTEEEWVEQLRASIERSVTSQMVSDVPLGAFLSGGVDSSAVVAFMAKASSKPIKTYSIGFSGGSADEFYNELPYARQVANQFSTDHHEIIVRPDLVTLLPRLLWHMDEPIADSAFLTTYLVSEFARREVTVILSGVGGDELFGGYRRYLGDFYLNRYKLIPKPVRALLAKVGAKMPSDRHSPLLNTLRYAKGFLASAEMSFEERYLNYVQTLSNEKVRSLLGRSEELGVDAVTAALRDATSDDGLNRLLFTDASTQLPDDLLLLTDKMSMATSLECRVPLLDQELVELSARIPESLKIRGGNLKYLMKKALRGVLSDDILFRKKRGFGAPMGAWLKKELKPIVRHVLSEDAIKRRGLFRPTVLQELISDHDSNRQDYTDQLLGLFNLEIWARIYLDGRSSEDVASELKEAA
jgi:asparagine synthase (glutamine-hydrolysing)